MWPKGRSPSFQAASGAVSSSNWRRIFWAVIARNSNDEIFVVVGVGTNRKNVARTVYLALAVASFPSFRSTARSDSQMREIDSRFISFCEDAMSAKDRFIVSNWSNPDRAMQIANPNSMFGTHVTATMDYNETKAGYLKLLRGDVVQVLCHHAHPGEYSDFFRW